MGTPTLHGKHPDTLDVTPQHFAHQGGLRDEALRGGNRPLSAGFYGPPNGTTVHPVGKRCDCTWVDLPGNDPLEGQ